MYERFALSPKVKATASIAMAAILLAFATNPAPVASENLYGITNEASGEPLIVVLPPRASAEIPVNGFCLNRGLPFPGNELTLTGMAEDNIRAAIAYASDQGLERRDLYGLQLGVWAIANGPNPRSFVRNARERRLADELEAAVKTASAPPLAADGTSTLLDSIQSGAITAKVIDYRDASSAGDFYGAGKLVLVNTTDKEQKISIPYGIRAKDASKEGNQDMGIFPNGDPKIDAPVVGPAGPGGPQGPTGSVGPQGPKGEAGAAGPIGPKGEVGPTGATGPAGPKGDVGAEGPQGPAGKEGPSGPVGPKGDPGTDGPTGPKGDIGPQGPAGLLGINGTNGLSCWDKNGNAKNDFEEDTNKDKKFDANDCVGPQGVSGLVGAPGKDGPLGPKGEAGAAGPIGPKGEPGPQGLPGAPGKDGAVGPSGPAGPTGKDGEIGPLGPVGPKGDQGDPGPAGLSGLPGSTGANGLSCWDTNGNGKSDLKEDINGDDKYNNLDCAGPAGAPGSQGISGPQGPSGPQGDVGPIGPAGLSGLKGDVGPTGSLGPTGPEGKAGPIGLTGASGPQGDVGPIGPIGPAGAKGDSGLIGPKGEPGALGPVGPKGDTGPTGLAGPTGAPGANGISCWDRNLNGSPDANEDVNGDDKYNALDCLGPAGPLGPQGPKGEIGALGPAGPQGQAGPIGPMGPQGPKGDPGAIGPQGNAGLVGAIGPQGDKGDTGPAGPNGDSGPQGPAGVVGPQGPAGLSCWDLNNNGTGDANEDVNGDKKIDGADCIGPQGAPGTVGEIGPQGPAGESGAVGPLGPVGPKGDTGPVGSVGLTGPQGPKGDIGSAGPQGASGLSCWDTNANGKADAKEDINKDTKVDMLDCNGVTGPQGSMGPAGPIGAAGPRGDSGPAGAPAALGITRVSKNSPMDSTLFKTAEAICPVDMIAVSGGAQISSSLMMSASMMSAGQPVKLDHDTHLLLQESFPSGDNAWRVTAVKDSTCNCERYDWMVTAWAICIAKP